MEQQRWVLQLLYGTGRHRLLGASLLAKHQEAQPPAQSSFSSHWLSESRRAHTTCPAASCWQPLDRGAHLLLQAVINRHVHGEKYHTPTFEAAGYQWCALHDHHAASCAAGSLQATTRGVADVQLLERDDSPAVNVCSTAGSTAFHARCMSAAGRHLLVWTYGRDCREDSLGALAGVAGLAWWSAVLTVWLPLAGNLLVYPNGRDRRDDSLGVFLNCVTTPQETTFGWQRRSVKFSLHLVNLLDPAKGVQKGVHSCMHLPAHTCPHADAVPVHLCKHMQQAQCRAAPALMRSVNSCLLCDGAFAAACRTGSLTPGHDQTMQSWSCMCPALQPQRACSVHHRWAKTAP